jgi:hypothetical protein
MNFRIDEASVIAESGSSLYPYFKCRREIAYLAITIISSISAKEITITYSTFLVASFGLLLTATLKDIL